ncbi:MAG: 5'-nucleotidase, lipoprotein e(P4) family [Mucilaginibacter sp.]
MKKTYLYLPCILMLIGFSSCKHKRVSDGDAVRFNDGKLWALLYQQRAAEYKALCFQAYNIAKLRLDASITQHGDKPFAVITDVDETLLDNSRYNAANAVQNLDLDASTWKQWTAKGKADTVPGAPSFLKYAASKGVTIFYITNRGQDEQTGTLANLKKYGLPFADAEHLLLKQTTSSKELRRQQVFKTHNVVLLCGDNLADFDALYDNGPSEAERTAITKKLIAEFGNRYIVIPNSAYGGFENALYDNRNLTPDQKDSVIIDKIRTNWQQ